jgi:hypothetical protein
MPTGSLVFQGDLPQLLGLGPPCTWEAGATGDRWCAFIAASAADPNSDALFVVNATKAAAGVSISCGATDANCLKLTDNYVEDQFHAGMFGGDTLVYYDLTGTPFGWRPGLTAGRALAVADPTTFNVVECTASSKGTAVYCLRDLPDAMQTDPNNLVLSDLLVGKIDDAANPPLVRVETVISVNLADMTFAHFQVGFPVPGSDTIAWSARATGSGPEILKMQTMGNDASRATIASGISGWSASPDGARWYWLSQVSETTAVGTLQSAPYPGGASPIAVAPNTNGYTFPTPTSLLVLDSAKQLLGFADPAGAPTTSQTLDTGVAGLISLSAQGHVAYAKTTSTTAGGSTFSDLFVKKSDGTGACALSTATTAVPSGVIFTPSVGGVTWRQRASTTTMAQFTSLSDCTLMNVGPGVAWTQPIGDRAVLLVDGFSSLTGTFNLRFRNLVSGNAVSGDPAALISSWAGSFASTASAGTDIVLYTVNNGSNDDGVYVRSFGP